MPRTRLAWPASPGPQEGGWVALRRPPAAQALMHSCPRWVQSAQLTLLWRTSPDPGASSTWAQPLALGVDSAAAWAGRLAPNAGSTCTPQPEGCSDPDAASPPGLQSWLRTICHGQSTPEPAATRLLLRAFRLGGSHVKLLRPAAPKHQRLQSPARTPKGWQGSQAGLLEVPDSSVYALVDQVPGSALLAGVSELAPAGRWLRSHKVLYTVCMHTGVQSNLR